MIKIGEILKEIVKYQTNDINKNFKLLKDSIENGNAVTFKYLNAWSPHNTPNPDNYKSLAVEIFTIGKHKTSGNVLARGFLTAGKSNRNQPIKWRTFLLSNMKDVRILNRQSRVVRSLYHSPDQNFSEIFSDLIDFYVPSNVRHKFIKRTKKVDKSQVKSTRIMGQREEDKAFNKNKSIFKTPKDAEVNADEEGRFEDNIE